MLSINVITKAVLVAFGVKHWFLADGFRVDDNVSMSDVTRILSQIESGDPSTAEQLLPLVYDELRKLAAARLAQERPEHTLQATALVHEAYLRLLKPGIGSDAPEIRELTPESPSTTPAVWHSRGHFFAAAAEAMRRILVENARQKQSLKRGGRLARVDLTHVDGNQQAMTLDPDPSDLLALEEALNKLDQEDQQAAAIAKLRLFAGLSADEAADALGISRTTAFRNWTYARAFLQAELQK
jgi:RNA polymerase sigma factor (sigma-70 family)